MHYIYFIILKDKATDCQKERERLKAISLLLPTKPKFARIFIVFLTSAQ